MGADIKRTLPGDRAQMTTTVRATPSGQSLKLGVRRAVDPVKVPGVTVDQVIRRLEEAGSTMLSMRQSGYSTKLRQMRFDVVHTALEAYGWETTRLRPAAPSAEAITAMDEAFGWLGIIPEESYVMRRILGARALVHPVTERYLYPWRRLAALLGADHKSVQRWHQQGVAILVKALQ